MLGIETACRDGFDGAVMYFHAKGVSRPGANPVTWWRWLMNAHVLSGWKDCLVHLETHDAAGVCLNSLPGLHFCGNFWWARSAWIRELDDFAEYRDFRYSGWGDHRGPVYARRYACELWITQGRRPGVFKSLFTRDAHIWDPGWWGSEIGREAKRLCLAQGC